MADTRTGFVVHAVITALVCALVITLNVTVASEFPWAIFPVAGTGMGLLEQWWFGYHHVDEMTRRHQAEIESRMREPFVR